MHPGKKKPIKKDGIVKLVTYRWEGATRHGRLDGANGSEIVVDLGPDDLLTLLQEGPAAIDE